MNEVRTQRTYDITAGYEFCTHTDSHGVKVTYQTAFVDTSGNISSINHESGSSGRTYTPDEWDFDGEARSFFRNLIKEDTYVYRKMRDKVNDKWKAVMEEIRKQTLAAATEKYSF
ncbi:MAG: hypothetical protein IKE91_04235 [Clostridia bacterium]|nr:hypothetical protein [Clostridia bacterium]